MPNKNPELKAKQDLKGTRNRRQKLDEMAQTLGYDSHYKMLTAMLSGFEAGQFDVWLTDALTDYYKAKEDHE